MAGGDDIIVPVPNLLPRRAWPRIAPVVAAILAVGTIYHILPASSGSNTFVAVADATVDAAQPTTNLGRSPTLVVQASPEARSYLTFSLSGVTGTITGARVRLYATTSGSGFDVRSVSSKWSETKTKYRGAPSVGPVAATEGPTTAGTWSVVDVSALVSGNGTVNLAITTGAGRSEFASRETATAPELVVDSLDPAPSPSPTPTTPSPTPTTPPPSGDPVIAAAGDIACSPGSNISSTGCRHSFTSDILVAGNYAAVLTLGDNQYSNGELSDYLGAYDPTWGRLKSVTHPAPGNHEYGTSGAAGYFDYFGAAAGDRGKGYYSYDVGTWHLIALNSNCSSVGGCDAGSPQEEWLRADLAAHPASCTIAYWHHPRFSSGQHGNSTNVAGLWQALYDGNADIVLSGHDHLYERFAPQNPNGASDPARGIREFVVGTGGKSLYSFKSPQPNSEVRHNQTFGVLELTLHPSSYDFRFVAEAGKAFSDAGSGTCH